jgi:hypothetical protein
MNNDDMMLLTQELLCWLPCATHVNIRMKNQWFIITCKSGSAEHCVKDGFTGLWEDVSFTKNFERESQPKVPMAYPVVGKLLFET